MERRARSFIDVAIQCGWLDACRAKEARHACDDAARRGERLLLGEVVVHEGWLSLEQLTACLDLARGYHEDVASGDDDPLFGDLAVRKGYVTGIQLFDGLTRQRDEAASGQPWRRIGEILLDAGDLAPHELDDVLATLGDLAGGSSRTGSTPTEPFAVGERAWLDDDEHGSTERYARGRASSSVRTLEHLKARAPAGRVAQLMTRSGVTVTPDMTVGIAVALARESETTHLIALQEDALVGVVAVADLLEATDRDVRVATFVTPAEALVPAHATLEEAAKILRDTESECLPAVVGSIVVGLLTIDDLRRAGFPERQLRVPLPWDEELGGEA